MSRLVAACAVTFLLCGSAVRAEDRAEIREVVVGFNGSWKVGQWTPIRARVRFPKATRATLLVGCVDADENRTVHPSELHPVQPGEAWVYGSFKAGRMEGALEVVVANSDRDKLASSRLQNGVPADGVPWTWKPPQRLDEPLWLALGEPGGLEALARGGPQERPIAVVSMDPTHLPHLGHMWSSVDVCLLAARPGVLQQITLRQNRAMRDWVRCGGHLFVGAGGDALKTVLGEHAPPFIRPQKEQKPLPVADWTPIVANGVVDVRQLSGLESFVGQTTPLRVTGAVLAPRLGDVPDGQPLVTGTSGAILLRVPFGFGRITFLGVDFSQPPLSTWPALPRLYRRVLVDRHGVSQKRSEGASVQLSRSGRSDLASQLHGAQEEFAAVRRPTYWGVMACLLVVLLVVGPLDYLIVTRWLKRPVSTWVTLPLLALGLCSVLYAGGLASNGTQRRMNELDIVDIDVASRTVRGLAWLTIYNPASGRLNLTAEPHVELAPPGKPEKRKPGAPIAAAVQRETMLSWTGVPESTLGGLYRSGGANFTQRGYLYDGTSAGLLDVPVSQWSTKALVAEWTQTAEVSVDSTLERTALGRLTGSFSHRLPGQLESVILVHGGHVYVPPGSVGRLSPGQVWRPGNPRGIKSTLTNAKTVPIYHSSTRSQSYLVQPEPYDPYDTDRDALVRMLSFHEGADGSRYTGLQHAALGRLEMTPLLDLNRAVLIGRLKSPLVTWKVDGSDQAPTERHTYVRLVLPVVQGKTGEAVDRPFIGGDP